MCPRGWPEVRSRNHDLAVRARTILCEALGVEPPCPEAMLGTMASVPLPEGGPPPAESALYLDPLQDVLLDRWGIEVPVAPWPTPSQRLLRVSAQLYNEAAQYERLAAALRQVFG